jgi:hypothetical protein
VKIKISAFTAIAAFLGFGVSGTAEPLPEIARATVSVAKDRHDDIVWENDRTAHRIYGHALEQAEPPSSSGIDAWGKRVRTPVMRQMIRNGDYHSNNGSGVDFFSVHGTRGAGGLGIWHDNKLWTSRNYRTVRILKDGPDVASFEVNYGPWPVDVIRTVRERRQFSLPMGCNFTRMVSRIDSNRSGALTVAIGVSKHPTSPDKGTLTVDRARGTLSFWTPRDAAKGSMGIALLFDPKQLVDVISDHENNLVLLRVEPGRPFVYYAGATWSEASDFPNRALWEQYVAAQRPDFVSMTRP